MSTTIRNRCHGALHLGLLTLFVSTSACAGAPSSALSVDDASFHSTPASANFKWASSAPLVSPPIDTAKQIYGVKDPSIVYSDGQYHVFMTTAGESGWGLAYTSFSNWSEAPKAPIFALDKSPMGPGYRAAPEVFYFAPQKIWYLIYQGGDPMYSWSKDIGDPLSWSAPKPFFTTAPDAQKHPDGTVTWLDFWIICDDAKCYLFNTDDTGQFFRSETTVEEFPNGFHNTVLVMKGNKDDVFEASNTYKVKGSPTYITLVEAIGPKGRYFRIWKSDRLDGEWQPFSSDEMNLFAGSDNVDDLWSDGISHGEMIRATADQTLTIDPCTPLKFLFQGNDPEIKVEDYIKIPYRLGVLTANAPNPVSALCVSHKP